MRSVIIQLFPEFYIINRLEREKKRKTDLINYWLYCK